MESNSENISKDLIKTIFEGTINATKLTHVLNKALNDDNFLCLDDTTITEKSINEQANKIWSLLRSSLSLYNPEMLIKKKGHLEERMKSLVEINDTILENIYKDLDISKGIDMNPKIEIKPQTMESSKKVFWNQVYQKNTTPQTTIVSMTLQDEKNLNTKTPTHFKTYSLMASSNITRPQLKYNIKVDNSKEPFFPSKLVFKAHSLKTTIIENQNMTMESIENIVVDSAQLNEHSETKDFNKIPHVNPYFEELENLQPMPLLFKESIDPKFPESLTDVPLIFVSSIQQLEDLIQDLAKEEIIAIDLEHHSYRSYLGLVCLMQISTRKKDYLVDTFTLWNDMNRLIKIFANPNILKVFHGAHKDIEWLQRDFSLYVVNLFDTFYASEALKLPIKSLAYLLMLYCGVQANKEFQLADWRIRPLPENLINYARSDTHYLIYIYERMKNDILERDQLSGHKYSSDEALEQSLIYYVFNKSRRLCQKVYCKPYYSQEFFEQLLKRQNKRFNVRQMFVLKQLNEWRDGIARKEDESPFYVLSNNTMLYIAEVLPKNYMNLLGCCNPVPPLLKQNIHQVQSIVQNALKQDLLELQQGLTLISEGQNISSNAQTTPYHQSPYQPHDIRTNLNEQFTQEANLSSRDSTNFEICGDNSQNSKFYDALSSPQVMDMCDLSLNHKHNDLHLNMASYLKTPFEIFRESENMKNKLKAEKSGAGEQSKEVDTTNRGNIENNDPTAGVLKKDIIPVKASQDAETLREMTMKRYRKLRPFDKLEQNRPPAQSLIKNNACMLNKLPSLDTDMKKIPTNKKKKSQHCYKSEDGGEVSTKVLRKESHDYVKDGDKKDIKKNTSYTHMFDEMKSYDHDITYTQIMEAASKEKKSVHISKSTPPILSNNEDVLTNPENCASSKTSKKSAKKFNNISLKRNARMNPNDQKFMPQDIDPHLCTHIIYAFGSITSNFGITSQEWNHKVLYTGLVNLKKINPDLKILLSIGGWSFNQTYFSKLAGAKANSGIKTKFIKEFLIYLRENGLDGLTIDWEFPGIPTRGGDAFHDKYNFAQFVKELRVASKEESILENKSRLLITITGAVANPMLNAGYDVEKLSKYSDYIFLLSYNFNGCWDEMREVGYLSPIRKNFNNYGSVGWAIQEWEKLGAEKEKLVIGIAAYGYIYRLESRCDKNVFFCGSGRKFRECKVSEPTFTELCINFGSNSENWTHGYDDYADAPFSYNDASPPLWVTYENEKSVAAKTEYILQEDLAGAFIWLMSGDDPTGKYCQKFYHPHANKNKPYPLITVIFFSLFVVGLYGGAIKKLNNGAAYDSSSGDSSYDSYSSVAGDSYSSDPYSTSYSSAGSSSYGDNIPNSYDDYSGRKNSYSNYYAPAPSYSRSYDSYSKGYDNDYPDSYSSNYGGARPNSYGPSYDSPSYGSSRKYSTDSYGGQGYNQGGYGQSRYGGQGYNGYGQSRGQGYNRGGYGQSYSSPIYGSRGSYARSYDSYGNNDY
ncbi:unnamed protein product [Gordionus sp. m RMFG-2023]